MTIFKMVVLVCLLLGIALLIVGSCHFSGRQIHKAIDKIEITDKGRR